MFASTYEILYLPFDFDNNMLLPDEHLIKKTPLSIADYFPFAVKPLISSFSLDL